MKKYLVKLVNQDIALLGKSVNGSIEWLKNPINSNAIPIVESNLRNAKLELAKHRLKKLEEMEF